MNFSLHAKRPTFTRIAAFAMVCMVTPPIWAAPAQALQTQLEALSQCATPGTFGIAVMDLRSGEQWGVHADRDFPMMSDFKAPVAAAILSRIDAGTLTMTQTVTITAQDVVPGSAVPSVGARFAGERMSFTLDQLMKAAVTESDNTAVDALIRVLGGPAQVTGFFRANGLAHMVVRDDERGIARLSRHLMGAAAPPADESPAQEQQRELAGYKVFLAAPPNTTTPDSSALFLKKLWRNELLSPASTHYLQALMYAQTTPRRLRAGLPAGTRLADKTGTSGIDGHTAAWNDIGVITWDDGQAVVIAGYLTDTTAPQAERDKLFADLARLVTQSIHPQEK